MAEVVGINGDRLAESDLVAQEKDDFVASLREILRQAEAGEILPRQWLLIYEIVNPSDHNIVARRSMDSGLTASDAIFMAEVFKADLLENLKG